MLIQPDTAKVGVSITYDFMRPWLLDITKLLRIENASKVSLNRSKVEPMSIIRALCGSIFILEVLNHPDSRLIYG